MNLEQLDAFRRIDRTTISVKDLTDQTERTLLLGYTQTGFTFHVYLRDGRIFRHVYSDRTIARDASEVWNGYDLVSGDHAYPECTDFEFAKILDARWIPLNFEKFDQARYDRAVSVPFAGKP